MEHNADLFEEIKEAARINNARKHENGLAYQREYYRLHGERVKARKFVGRAVKLGEIDHVSKCNCADCSVQAEHYHHESYEKDRWLDVIPLCGDCHRARHKAVPESY